MQFFKVSALKALVGVATAIKDNTSVQKYTAALTAQVALMQKYLGLVSTDAALAAIGSGATDGVLVGPELASNCTESYSNRW